MSAWGWVLLGATVAGWLVLLVAWKALCVAGAQADRDVEQMCAEQVTDKGAGLMAFGRGESVAFRREIPQ